MTIQKLLNFETIAEAIESMVNQYKNQTGINEIPESIDVNPAYLQKLFSEWAGVSPEKFAQYISANYMKQMLNMDSAVFSKAFSEEKLSGKARWHDLSVSLEGMSPEEYNNMREELLIEYNLVQSPFGEIFIATTGKGICYMSFADDRKSPMKELLDLFPGATFILSTTGNPVHQDIWSIPTSNIKNRNPIKLHVKGTPFQLKVWGSLLKIPLGRVTTYRSIAQDIGSPTASRAVGSAIGRNPVAFLIPCHRVIQTSGSIGQYKWGSTRKSAIIGWEAALVDTIRNSATMNS